MVGAGAVAARHVRTLLAMDGVRVVAVADPAVERARELKPEIAMTGNYGLPIRDEIELGRYLD